MTTQIYFIIGDDSRFRKDEGGNDAAGYRKNDGGLEGTYTVHTNNYIFLYYSTFDVIKLG